MINYIKGDATEPVGEGKKFIIHCCNDIGAWGSGFVLALNKRWQYPYVEYKNWADNGKYWYSKVNMYRPGYYNPSKNLNVQCPFVLGQIQLVKVEKDIYVINMIGQRGVGEATIDFINEEQVRIPPIRYESLKECLHRVAQCAIMHGASIHCPRFGSDRAGGNWNKIEKLITECLTDRNVSVTVYDLE